MAATNKIKIRRTRICLHHIYTILVCGLSSSRFHFSRTHTDTRSNHMHINIWMMHRERQRLIKKYSTGNKIALNFPFIHIFAQKKHRLLVFGVVEHLFYFILCVRVCVCVVDDDDDDEESSFFFFYFFVFLFLMSESTIHIFNWLCAYIQWFIIHYYSA